MFSVEQKRGISQAVQDLLRATNHPELPTTGEITFSLKVLGAESWSYADIKNNAAVGDPGVNPHNELMASMPEEEARELIEKAENFAQSVPDQDQRQQVPYAENLTSVMELEQRVTAEFNQLKDRLSLVEGKADGLIEKVHDPRATPDDLVTEMMKQQAGLVNKRIFKMEAIIVDYNKRLGKLEERDEIQRKLYSEVRSGLDRLEEFFQETIEDNLIKHHSDQLNNLTTAIRQLGNAEINKTLKGG